MAEETDTPNGATAQCRVCGSMFKKGSNAARYCRPCAAETKAQRTREYKARRRRRLGKARVGASMQCASCAAVIVRCGPLQKYCPTCRAEKDRLKTTKWKQKNGEWWSIYREANRELLNAKARAWSKTQKCRDGRRRRGAERRAKDPKFGLNERMSRMIRQALKEKKAGRRWETLVGYSVYDLIQHLERQFLPRMSWNNFGRWHIDHIVPIASFNYESADDPDFAACWALTNLRPLWSEKNCSKGAKRTHLL